MTDWDWTFVGELVFALAAGIGIGGAIFAHFLEVAALRVVSSPSVRKLANAADKFTGANPGGGWAGLIGQGLNFLTQGRFGAMGAPGLNPGEVPVVNEAGEVVGTMRRR